MSSSSSTVLRTKLVNFVLFTSWQWFAKDEFQCTGVIYAEFRQIKSAKSLWPHLWLSYLREGVFWPVENLIALNIGLSYSHQINSLFVFCFSKWRTDDDLVGLRLRIGIFWANKVVWFFISLFLLFLCTASPGTSTFS